MPTGDLLASLGQQREGWNELRHLQEQSRLQAQLAAQQQQIRHYQDMAAAQQRAYMGQFSSVSSFGVTNPYGSGAVNFFQTETEAQRTARLEREAEYRRTESERQQRQAEATKRALTLLENKIGKWALTKILAGGAYTVHSRQWPNVKYLIPKDGHQRIRVVADGSVVTQSCLVTTDPSLPWPDIMLQRIQAIEMDESILFETGVLSEVKRPEKIGRLRKYFKKD